MVVYGILFSVFASSSVHDVVCAGLCTCVVVGGRVYRYRVHRRQEEEGVVVVVAVEI